MSWKGRVETLHHHLWNSEMMDLEKQASPATEALEMGRVLEIRVPGLAHFVP